MPRLLLAVILVLAAPAAVVFALAARDRPASGHAVATPVAGPPPPVAVPTAAPTTAPTPAPTAAPAPRPSGPSRALGSPAAGRLLNGRPLPPAGPGFQTYDPILHRSPNRRWRRFGTERLLATVEHVLAAYARAHPGAPPVLVGDLSRPRGGNFGPRFGGIGHASHQNGLDADVYYPRLDGALRPPRRPRQVDRRAAQELVDAFVAAGAEFVFVGPSLDLRGPKAVVQPLVHHDNHLHVRIRGSGT
jgi:murein endopeptidase